MSTVGQIIDRAQRQLMSGTVEERNKLASSVSATATTLVMTYDLGGMHPGTLIQIDSEIMYVWESTPGTKTVVVERGQNGSTAAAHSASDVVTVNPKFPRNQILEAINDELADLGSPMNALFQVKNLDFTYNASRRQVNLQVIGEIIDIVDVRYRYIATDYKSVNNAKLMRNMPTKDFPSGYALRVDSIIPSSEMRVTYKAPFTRVTQENDNLQNIAGFPESAEDILIMGAQIRLVAPREVKRNFSESQGDTRRAEEVPNGAIANSIVNLIRMRRDRITAEAARLARQYPTYLNRL